MSWQPLAGVTVVDVTSVVMGPFATQSLADLGADVIVVEDSRGDANRAMGSSRHPQLSGVTLGLMRNKRSIRLDLKSDVGREVLNKLVTAADVFVTNLRPQSRHKLGIDYDTLVALNSRLVYCAACGFAKGSADENLPAYDDVIQGLVAVPYMHTRVGLPPSYAPTIFVDKTCGMAIAQAILAGLYQQATTGTGVDLSLSMYDIMRGFVLAEHGADSVSYPGERQAGYERLLAHDRRPQPTADGRIACLPYESRHFKALFQLGGRDDYAADPRLDDRTELIKNRHILRARVEEVLATKTTDEWLQLLGPAGVPAGRLNTLDDLVSDLELAEHPHAGAYLVVPSILGFTSRDVVRRPAPLHGEHTAEILADLGYSTAAIAELT